ncbi:response regulator transcription factor [Nonomuraea sp. NPDC005983]|uniref:response regulator transcription factor n=1 Tax=Nonomuraea sp. NPDC005983 TaxID=3155595 RepID=UPI0033B24865
MDDHPFMREGITRFFEQSAQVAVVASTADPGQVPHEVDVLLLDLYLENGRPSLPVIADWSARARVLVMSVSGEQADVVAAIQAGASGYLTKSSEPAEFHAAVVSVASGGFVLGSGLAGILHGQLSVPASPLAGRPALSPREAEVLAHLAKGRTRRQTAGRMGVAESTVDTLVKRIRVKLGLGAMADLVRAADELGLRPPGE